MPVILFILVLLILVVGHEFGHFVVAKLTKMKVLEFGVGFPPKIWGKKIGETEYTINWLPFGGFVKIFGEDPPTPEASDGQVIGEAMFNRSKLSQAAVIGAGPFMNVVIGFLLLSVAFMAGVPAVVDEGSPDMQIRDAHLVVGDVLPGSPAQKSGIKPGDRILSADTPEAFTKEVADATGPVTVSVMRDRKTMSITATPQSGLVPDDPSRKVLGIETALVGTKHYSFFGAISAAAIATAQDLRFIVLSLGGLIVSIFKLTADLSGVAGPVGIATMTGSAAAFGLGSLLSFAAMLSLNLSIVNLLPFPALDGGRLVFLAAEAVTRRKIPPAFARGANGIGFALLILLMLVVTFHDVVRLIG